ncbi:hypothetical protein L7F22_024541 [Adiantum nelumboides]|nr:hypothetical protein [Adiantum nelumboides]
MALSITKPLVFCMFSQDLLNVQCIFSSTEQRPFLGYSRRSRVLYLSSFLTVMDELWRKRLVGAGSMKEVSKWAGLVAAIWVQSFAGNSAAYANYSSKLKSVLTLTQVQLNYLALCKDLGENVGILAGFVCNKVPPWVILSVAALEGLLGFGSLWLVASGTISPRPLWQVEPNGKTVRLKRGNKATIVYWGSQVFLYLRGVDSYPKYNFMMSYLPKSSILARWLLKAIWIS